jgi:hypothetical protein
MINEWIYKKYDELNYGVTCDIRAP